MAVFGCKKRLHKPRPNLKAKSGSMPQKPVRKYGSGKLMRTGLEMKNNDCSGIRCGLGQSDDGAGGGTGRSWDGMVYMVWHGMVWHCMVWYGMAWDGGKPE